MANSFNSAQAYDLARSAAESFVHEQQEMAHEVLLGDSELEPHSLPVEELDAAIEAMAQHFLIQLSKLGYIDANSADLDVPLKDDDYHFEP